MTRRCGRGRLRRLAAAAAAPLVALAVLAPAAPAWAGGQVHVPSEPVTTPVVVDIAAKVDAGSPAEARLELRGPGFAKARQVAHAEAGFGDRTLVFRLDLASCNVPNEPTCAGGDVPNGTWTAQLFTATRSEPVAAARFQVRVPARQPTGVTAAVDGRAVVVSWDRGSDRDLSEWRVDEHSGGDRARAHVVPAADCSADAARCSATFAYADSDTGSRGFSVQAVRTCADEDCGPLPSQPSATVNVTLPRPAATPGPGAGGATSDAGSAPGGAAGGTATPGASGTTGGGGAGADPVAAAVKDFAQSFSSFAPKLGLPKLPPLPTTATQPVPAPQLPDGGFEQTLGYEDRVVTEQAESGGGPVSVLTSVGEGLLGSEDVAEGVAGALVLVLSAAHLRRWLAAAGRDASA